MTATVLRQLVGAVLVIAAGAKTADVSGFGRTLAGLGFGRFGVGTRRRVATGLVATELCFGCAAAAVQGSRIVDAGLVVITATFAVAIATALIHGVRVHCHCFGALSGTSFSMSGLLRALGLVALSVIVLVLDGPEAANLTLSGGGIAVCYLALAGVARQASLTVAQVNSHREAIA